jgi:hypothetical protein
MIPALSGSNLVKGWEGKNTSSRLAAGAKQHYEHQEYHEQQRQQEYQQEQK